MKCDKCGNRFDYDLTQDIILQRYKIKKMCGLLYNIIEINLCDDCSRKFKEWLENEENVKVD